MTSLTLRMTSITLRMTSITLRMTSITLRMTSSQRILTLKPHLYSILNKHFNCKCGSYIKFLLFFLFFFNK
jgi:hypothetical protein